MYYRNEVISYLQANKILALKLDHALTGVGKAVSNQIETIGAGATRTLYYTSCFTNEYQDVCQQQKAEDIRFTWGVYHIIRRENVVCEMLKIYFEDLFRYKTSDQIEHIKQMFKSVFLSDETSTISIPGYSARKSLRLGIKMACASARGTSSRRRPRGGRVGEKLAIMSLTSARTCLA